MYIVYLEQKPCDKYANIETQSMRVQKKIVCPQPGKEEELIQFLQGCRYLT